MDKTTLGKVGFLYDNLRTDKNADEEQKHG